MGSCRMGLGLLAASGGGGRRVLVVCAVLCLVVGLAAGNIVLIGKNVSLSFNDIEASFAPGIKGSGECGVLYTAVPLDACTPLTNKIVEGPYSPFILIIRGGCTFEDKIKSAEHAGFKAAIIYDNEDSGALVAMAGTSSGIHIHAVFVSKASGDVLKEYAGRRDVELWIIPSFENSAWSIMAISFISLLALSAVLATCFFVRRHRVRRPRTANVREFHGMSSRLVRAMPSLIFTSVLEDNSTSSSCAICIEDYKVGERLRILPCSHKFHANCVDAWLTSWRTFCPVCKQDARTSTGNPPASEFTPLLSPASSIAAISSFHSSVAASPSAAIPIRATPVQSPLTSRTHSLSSVPHVPNTRRSYNNSPAISFGGSSLDLRNASPNRSCTAHLLSAHSLGYPSSSPMNSRHLSAYLPSLSNESPGYLAGSSGRQSFLRNFTMSSPSNASPSYLAGSSGRQSFLRHFTESATNLSAQASAESLPGC